MGTTDGPGANKVPQVAETPGQEVEIKQGNTMPRLKKNRSSVLDNAETRAAALAAIEPPLAMGGELTLTAYQAKITATREIQNRYNGLLAEADKTRAELGRAERELGNLSDRMLAAVGGFYGRDSVTYVAAGGTLKYTRTRKRKTALANEMLPSAA